MTKKLRFLYASWLPNRRKLGRDVHRPECRRGISNYSSFSDTEQGSIQNFCGIKNVKIFESISAFLNNVIFLALICSFFLLFLFVWQDSQFRVYSNLNQIFDKPEVILLSRIIKTINAFQYVYLNISRMLSSRMTYSLTSLNFGNCLTNSRFYSYAINPNPQHITNFRHDGGMFGKGPWWVDRWRMIYRKRCGRRKK